MRGIRAIGDPDAITADTEPRPQSKGASPGVLAAQCVRLWSLRTRRRCFVFPIILFFL